MNEDLTARELSARRVRLEAAAATLLGRMLIEFSRLDTELGLCAAWVGKGQRLDELNPSLDTMNFYGRLKFVRYHVAAAFDSSGAAYLAYSNWLDRADRMRSIRNELVHGRWGVNAVDEEIVNVIGLPTSPNQRCVKYTVSQLTQLVESLVALCRELGSLREVWPL
jgi:hypothetical protein